MPTQDFPRSCRLLTSRDFSAVFDGANVKKQTPSFLLLAINNIHTYPRLGCIVAKKHVKQAVQRNRIKRIIREAFRVNKKTLTSYDVVIMVKKGIIKQDNKTLLNELALLWKNII